MAIRTEAGYSGKPRIYVNVRYKKPQNNPQPLGMSTFSKYDGDGNLIPDGGVHTEIKGGIDGVISHIAVRSKDIKGDQVEQCFVTLSDDGEYDTVLVFNTGGPDGYTFKSGDLVARLLAASANPTEPVLIQSYVFEAGTEKTLANGSKVKREEAEVYWGVIQNGQSLKPFWGMNEDGTARERGPEAPDITNGAGVKVGSDYTVECRPFMVGALQHLQEVYNTPRQQQSEHEAGIDTEQLAGELEDDSQLQREREGQ